MDKGIYHREDLLETYKNPSNWGSITNPSISVVEKNPMCGDTLNVDVEIKDDKIADIKYSGDSCSVAIISASMVTEELIGKNVDEIKSLTKEYILELTDMELTTSRIKCATLIMEALKRVVKEYENDK